MVRSGPRLHSPCARGPQRSCAVGQGQRHLSLERDNAPYRTAGDWGSGKGSNLTPAEVDGNFWAMIPWFASEVSGLPNANGIASVTVSADNVMDVCLDDGAHFGPFTIATNTLNWSGAWVPSTAYSVNDVFSVAGSGVVRVAHRSDTSFSPTYGPNHYDQMLSADDSGLTGAGPGSIYIEDDTLSTPPGSPWIGSFWLVKPTGTGAWAGHNSDIAYWDGAWQFIDPVPGMLIWGFFDGSLTLPHMKVWEGSSWVLLGNYLKEAQGLRALSVGGGWDADESETTFYAAGDKAAFSHNQSGGGTGHHEINQSRYSSSYNLWHHCHLREPRRLRAAGCRRRNDRRGGDRVRKRRHERHLIRCVRALHARYHVHRFGRRLLQCD
jgi:hypothetical protein